METRLSVIAYQKTMKHVVRVDSVPRKNAKKETSYMIQFI